MLESDSTNSARLEVKEAPTWDFVEVDKYICSIRHNQINLGNKILYNLLDHGNDYIENITTKEQVACNSLTVIDVKEKIILRQDFDIFEDGKRLNSLQNSKIKILH